MSLDSDWNSYLQVRLLKDNLLESGHQDETQVQRPQAIKKKIFQCPKCEHTATQGGNLRRHISAVHEAERKYKCPQCDHKTAQKSNLQIHIKSKHEGIRYPCPHCNHIASQKSYLKKHIQSEHEGDIKKHKILDKNYLKTENRETENLQDRISESKKTLKFDIKKERLATINPKKIIEGMKHPEEDLKSKNKFNFPIKQDHHNLLKKSIQSECKIRSEPLQAIKSETSEEKNESPTKEELKFPCPKAAIHDGHTPSKCLESEYKSSHKSSLQLHIKGKKTSFQCPECEHTATQKTNLKRHIVAMHDGQTPFKCLDCGYKSSHKSGLQLHIKSKHEGNKSSFQCPKCDYKAKWKANLKRHLAETHVNLKSKHLPGDSEKSLLKGMEMLHCPHCDFKALQKSNLHKHIAAIHNGKKPFRCPECEHQTSQKYNLQLHIQSMHEGIRFPCPQCDYTASRKLNLKQHIQSKHEGVRYSCSHCDYTSPQYIHLLAHARSVHEGLRFQCLDCKFKTKWKKDLQRHMLDQHSKIITQCKRDLEKHMIIGKHKLQIEKCKVYVCSECEYKATKKVDLDGHIKQHTKHTNSKFISQLLDLLLRDVCMNSHNSTGGKLSVLHQTFYCSKCDYKTTLKANLESHLQSEHTNSKFISQIIDSLIQDVCKYARFPCSHCDYKATQKVHLNGHIKAKHDGQKWQCPDCKYSSSWTKDFKRHMKHRHSTIISQKRRDLQKYMVKKAKKKVDLDEHIKLTEHTNPKFITQLSDETFYCSKCDYKTTLKADLESHMQSEHTNPKFITQIIDLLIQEVSNKGYRIPCPRCNDTVARKYHLQLHIQSKHEGVRFPCPHCDYMATQKVHLNGHIKAKHEGKKLQCPDCQYRASWTKDFKRHMKNMHSKTISQKRTDLEEYMVDGEIDYFDIDIID